MNNKNKKCVITDVKSKNCVFKNSASSVCNYLLKRIFCWNLYFAEMELGKLLKNDGFLKKSFGDLKRFKKDLSLI